MAARTTRNERRIAATCRGTHPICVSSDSGLPECACWCAECNDPAEYGEVDGVKLCLACAGHHGLASA